MMATAQDLIDFYLDWSKPVNPDSVEINDKDKPVEVKQWFEISDDDACWLSQHTFEKVCQIKDQYLWALTGDLDDLIPVKYETNYIYDDYDWYEEWPEYEEW